MEDINTLLSSNLLEWMNIPEDARTQLVTTDLNKLDGLYDYLIVTDTFTVVSSFMEGRNPYENFLEILMEHLSSKGHLIIATDNRLGLKFFAGSKENKTKMFFEGLEGYPSHNKVETLSRNVLLKLVKKCGFNGIRMYYPYPDWREMVSMYSDFYHPKAGELVRNYGNIGEEHIQVFDEDAVFDSIAKDGMFPEFSNAFLLDLTFAPQVESEWMLFTKYSTERAAKYQIRTDILERNDGMRLVRKIPVGEGAWDHLRALKDWERKLARYYGRHGILVNHCEVDESKKAVYLEYLEGVTFEEYLDNFLYIGDYEGLTMAVQEYVRKLYQVSSISPFTMSDGFEEIFGQISFPVTQKSASLTNIDWIFSNILLTERGHIWNIVDYEWTFAFPIPIKFVIYRAVTLYLQSSKRKILERLGLLQLFDISVEEEEVFAQMEHSLQCYILKDTKTMAQRYLESDGRRIQLSKLLETQVQRKMQIFMDKGNGFNSEDSYYMIPPEDKEGIARFDLILPAGVKKVRIDPCETYCLVTIKCLLGECAGVYELSWESNGKEFDTNNILYSTVDPQLTIKGIVDGTDRIHVELLIEPIKEGTAFAFMNAVQMARKAEYLMNTRAYRWSHGFKKRKEEE